MPEFNSSEFNEVELLNWTHPFLNKEYGSSSYKGLFLIIDVFNFNLMTI